MLYKSRDEFPQSLVLIDLRNYDKIVGHINLCEIVEDERSIFLNTGWLYSYFSMYYYLKFKE